MVCPLFISRIFGDEISQAGTVQGRSFGSSLLIWMHHFSKMSLSHQIFLENGHCGSLSIGKNAKYRVAVFVGKDSIYVWRILSFLSYLWEYTRTAQHELHTGQLRRAVCSRISMRGLDYLIFGRRRFPPGIIIPPRCPPP